MAQKKKKPRTPPPPRNVQGPKQRVDPLRVRREGPGPPRDPRKTRLIFIGLIVAIVVVALAAGLGIALGGGSGGDQTAGGCEPQSFAELDRLHSETLPPGYAFNSFPPTSGTHNPIPAIWNIYEQPVKQLLLVHNLEHGGIVVQYGDQVPEATVDEIRAWYREDPEGLIVAPLPAPQDESAESRSQVYVTAWTQLLTCPGFSQPAFEAFKDAHRGEGPERFPVDSLKPGT